MSYLSLLKNLPEIFSQPTGIAAIASLGIHGAIALIVPLVPVDSNKPKETASSKTVGVMELSQADQSRLPQIPGSSPINPQSPVLLQQSQIPPLNLGSQTSLPALPPAPPASSQFVMPPIPSSVGNYPISALPKRQSLRNYSQGNFRFDTSGFNGNSKFSTSASRFNNREIALGEAKPLPRNNLPVLPDGKLPDGLPNAAAPLPVDSNPTPMVDVAATAQNTQPGDNTSKVGTNQQLIAGIATTPQVGDNLTIAQQGIPQGQLGSTPISNQLPKPGTEEAIAQIQSFRKLRESVQQQYPNAVEKSVIRDTITTDKSDAQGVVLGRLVVDPDGKVLEIKFEGTSVSPALQVKAREYFNTHPLKGERQIANYPFSLEFKNNSNTATGDTQKPAPASAATVKPLNLPLVNSNQPTAAPGANVKPFTLPAVNSNQPTAAPGANVKPLTLPAVNSNQLKPIPMTNTKPLTVPAVNSNQPTPLPATTLKPSSNPLINKLQSVPAPTTTVKPLAGPVPTPAATVKPLAAPTTNSNQPAPVVESGKKLVQQLRQLREQRETSNQDK